MDFDSDAIVGAIIKGYVQQPDYSNIRDEIEEHKAPGFCRVKRDENDRCPGWCKILFVTSETVIIQEVELTFGQTRFQVRNIPFPEWKGLFVEWIGNLHTRYVDVAGCWIDGMCMYGANV